jgi:nucleotide-binding universal stress UspA family protein
MRLLTLKTILVATELDDAALPAVVAASRLANASGASLHVVTVRTHDAHHDEHGTADAWAQATAILTHAGADADHATIHVLEGDPVFAIGSLADRLRADVIVLGPARNRQAGASALGGTALAVVTNASSPCLVVSGSMPLPLRRVLVPVDLSETARGALLVGLSWASALRGSATESSPDTHVVLTALHVQRPLPDARVPAWPDAIERELDFIRKESGTWAGVSIEARAAAAGDIAGGIADYVGENASDLVVMGTRGLGLDPVGRLGSVTASAMKLLAAPALLVPPAVWMTHARSS